MPLNWATSGTHTIEAIGSKGVYTLRRAPGGFAGCVLTAIGHDGLPMLALPPFGKSFGRPSEAKDFVERVESTKAVEPLGGVG